MKYGDPEYVFEVWIVGNGYVYATGLGPSLEEARAESSEYVLQAAGDYNAAPVTVKYYERREILGSEG